MKPFASLKIYPRPDSEYKSKSSLDFQRVLGNLYGQRPTGSVVQAYLWVLCFIVGMTMGILAFLLDLLVENLIHVRWHVTEAVVRSANNPLLGLPIILGFSVVFVMIGSGLTAYLSPQAAGSGVAETMGILNGVKYPDFITIQALIVKFFGVALGVSGGLTIGKEGPLVHMGAIVGQAIPYLPLGISKYFRNDFEKRKLLAVGVASGVSAAFGAPIGGALFAYELSKPNTFWSFSLTWKVFFASTIATFTLSIFKQIQEGVHLHVSSSDIIKLGNTQSAPTLDSLFGALVIGVIGGLLGAVFIRFNNQVNVVRKKLLKTNNRKIIETLVLTVVTVTVMYMAITINYWGAGDSYQTDKNFCDFKNETLKDNSTMPVPTIQFLCEDDARFDRLATLLFDT